MKARTRGRYRASAAQPSDADACACARPRGPVPDRWGARRLHTVLERLLEEISFTPTDKAGEKIAVDAAYVNQRVAPLAQKGDLSKFIL